MTSSFNRHPVAAAVCLLVAAISTHPALAQSVPALPEITITGNPLSAIDLIAPAAQYTGTSLLFRTKSTLGETLDGTPGISSTYFGPNASRPIIRGLDGDRIRILQNSGASIDASGLSYDHAVPSDPISMERIEVLRGPGALMYGGNAVGGVVNVIDNRIPREPLFDAVGGITGKADLGFASGNAEKGAGLMLEAGTDRFTIHADVFNRSAGDTAVPIGLACTKAGAAAFDAKICNSAAETRGGAVGGSLFFGEGGQGIKGYLGASVGTYASDYGTVAEDAVTIGMKADRVSLEGELRDLKGPLQSIKAQFSRSDYQHTEFEAGAVGTVFKNAGNDLRLEARHMKLGPLEGVVGIQLENSQFSADGTEAFAPYSRTDQKALFAYEELPTAWGKLSFGARVESVTVESQGNPLVARFVPGNRSFNPASYALGALWKVAPGWHLTSNLAYSERAPKDYELFADGPHIATNSYEVGNANFTKEQSANLDVGVQWKSGANRFALSAFVNQFSNYISLDGTGINRDTDGNGGLGVSVTDSGNGDNTSLESGGAAGILPEFAYTQVAARFTGLEASGTVRLLDVGQTLDLELRGDLVRAVNTNTQQNLPRIAPVRLGATLVWAQGPWGARLGASYSAAQNDVAPGQPTTAAYTLLDTALSYRQKAGATNLLWFAKVDNLTDVLAYSASSILTQTAPGKAPLPGRGVKLGLQVTF